MDSIASSFLIIAFVPMTVMIGLFHLIRPFGALYAIPAATLIALAVFFQTDKERSARFILAAMIGQWFSLLSWIFSRHAITVGEAAYRWASDTASVAVAGFPISAIEIPPSPMGSDVIPAEMWVGVFTNHVFWFIVAFLLSKPLLRHITKRWWRLTDIASVMLGFYALIANLALFALWYD